MFLIFVAFLTTNNVKQKMLKLEHIYIYVLYLIKYKTKLWYL